MESYVQTIFFAVSLLLAVGLCEAKYDYCQAPGIIPSENTDGLELQLLQILVRHGDRTPEWTMPIEVEWNCTLNWLNLPSNDFVDSMAAPKRLYRKTYLPNREILPGDCMYGQLTEKGLQQHLVMGAQLRALYVDKYQFLSPQLNLDEIWIRSTDVPRTVQSVMANLWTFYPPETRPDGNITVIDINTMDNALEDMTPNTGICDRLNQLYNELQNSTEWRDHDAKLKPLLDQLNKIWNSTSLPDWGGMWDNLGARTCHNKSFPEGLTPKMLQQIYDAAAWQNWFIWSNDESGLLGSGFLLEELQARIVENMEGETLPKMVFYSGHDSTVGPLMASLADYFIGWPPYASNVQMELWSNPSRTQFFAQVKYNGEVVLVKGCSDVMCPIDQFQNVLNSRIPHDPDVQCQAHK
eukprot:TRINITY_DN3607_c0_g1_i1.p1 TRINITY_DN3607_c0_g1~~TRINITY_DN3607_c0_g1_i1.p1  ORF type:complete len:435 (-),score=74.74 TRINITY_DN3607_c0_g1_i1:48-1274(-)